MCGLVWLNKHFAEGRKALRKGGCEGDGEDVELMPFTELMETSPEHGSLPAGISPQNYFSLNYKYSSLSKN